MNKKGDILFGKIIQIQETYLKVKTKNNYIYTIPLKNITDWSSKYLPNEFSLDEKINFILEEVNDETQSGIGNFKLNHPLYSRSPFKENLAPTKHGYKNLKTDLENSLKTQKE